jgi:hypothetical protein
MHLGNILNESIRAIDICVIFCYNSHAISETEATRLFPIWFDSSGKRALFHRRPGSIGHCMTARQVYLAWRAFHF